MSIRELRNHGGEVIARVRAAEPLTVTHSGLPVTSIDLAELRRDIDELIDPALPALPDEDAHVTGIDGLDVREVRLVAR